MTIIFTRTQQACFHDHKAFAGALASVTYFAGHRAKVDHIDDNRSIHFANGDYIKDAPPESYEIIPQPSEFDTALMALTASPNITDKDRIDFLEALNAQKHYTGKCLVRWSGSGRGWRLHEAVSQWAKQTVREAIDDAITSKRME